MIIKEYLHCKSIKDVQEITKEVFIIDTPLKRDCTTIALAYCDCCNNGYMIDFWNNVGNSSDYEDAAVESVKLEIKTLPTDWTDIQQEELDYIELLYSKVARGLFVESLEAIKEKMNENCSY